MRSSLLVSISVSAMVPDLPQLPGPVPLVPDLPMLLPPLPPEMDKEGDGGDITPKDELPYHSV